MYNAIPLSLYIHFPWCIRKCPYCDFNSYKLTSPLNEHTYIDALLEDLKADLIYVQNRPITSIFMGGGTPSLFSADSMEYLLSSIKNHLTLSPHCEITMEMNPGAVEHGHLAGYRSAGINRLSIGVQSFQPHQLKKLGRVHNDMEAVNVVHRAQESGFNNINIDLMYALPEQTVEDALFDLQKAIDLKPQHLSWYHLTIEPNTEFYRTPPKLPDEEVSIAIEIAGKKLLKESGFQQYEVSAYSTKKHESQHNKNYWEFGDYLGIGAGAHSKITDLKTGEITRYWKQKVPASYLNAEKNYVAGKRVLTEADKITEFMFNALRLAEGFPVTLLTERTGLTVEHMSAPLALSQQKGLLAVNKTHIKPTPLGYQYLNEAINLFM